MGATLSNKTKSRGRRTGGSYRPMAEINVTPFVDVILVLLIVFMVSAPLLSTGVAVDLPQSDAKALSEEENKPIEITVTKDDAIYLAETKVEGATLVPLLQAMTEGQMDRRIYIRGDSALSYGRIMRIIGDINGAGFTKVALVSERR